MDALPPRLFFALGLPPSVRAALSTVINRFQGRDRGVRWVNPANLHLTLRFLGDLPVSMPLEDLLALAEPARSMPAPTLSLEPELGRFPTSGRLRVIWAGVSDASSALAELAGAIDQQARQVGFPRDRDSFAPHITLGRVGPGAGVRALEEKLERVEIPSISWRATRVTLFDSRPPRREQNTPGPAHRHEGQAAANPVYVPLGHVTIGDEATDLTQP